MPRDYSAAAPLDDAFLTAVGASLDGFLEGQRGRLAEIGSLPMLEVARSFTTGGKRLRPAFCYWANVAVAGSPPDPAPLLTLASSLDLLHVSALVHDDLIDAADTRRGLPAAHRQFEERHRAGRGRGAADEFGVSSAILLGDLLLMWSIEMADGSGAPHLDRARPLLSATRTEVTAGQYLDVAAQFGMAGAGSIAEELAVAKRVLEYKSARYSVRRPIQIGAALGDADEALIGALGEFGSLVGRAFQLRDDLLGVFGDPAVTGKPWAGDLREGKRTVLALTALNAADAAQQAVLSDVLGSAHADDDLVAEAAAVIEDTGARADVEAMIDEGLARALALLDGADITQEGRTALRRLAELSVRRAA
ncbi:MAG TPA: polyprenyl synthetase family protein [Arachnia sp.]|nr:polyprenyl synthetase family protein [Arachnia sp.]HMT85460.1 polyprenyl synthetase family protein [Arachnia sp.]